MEIDVVPCLTDNYAYLLIDGGGHTVIVDPSEAEPVLEAIRRRGLQPVGIWATHHHHDHVGGIEKLLEAYPRLEVVGSRYDAEHKRIPRLTHAVSEGDPLWFESRRVRLLFVPGHTLGAVTYVCDGAAFTGDTLFAAGCGRMFEGTPEVMQGSLSSLRSLPGDTRMYCGHEYTEKNLLFAAHIEPDNPVIRERIAAVRAQRSRGEPSVPTTIASEHEVNPFLRWDVPAVIERARSLGAASDAPPDVFAALRRAKDQF
ncbi:MAG: hydroxyacylglutathione hydrolase [Polyangiales bacterium]